MSRKLGTCQKIKVIISVNFYSPVYQFSTCDSEFISLTGMIPSIDYGTTSKTFAQNYYLYSLPNLLKDKGY